MFVEGPLQNFTARCDMLRAGSINFTSVINGTLPANPIINLDGISAPVVA